MDDQTQQGHDAGHGWRNVLAKLVGTYQRRMITLLLLVYVLDFADRALIGALGPTLERVFHIDNTLLGLLVTAVSIVSALATIPFGVLTDRVRRVWLLAISLMLWMVAEGLVGASVGFLMLIIVRVFLGIISAVSGPTVPSMVGDLVPLRDRARTFGAITTGQIFGVAIGFVLPVIVLAFATWRATFWVLAAFGLLLSIAFWLSREPRRSPVLGPGSQETDEQPVSLVREIVQQRGVRPNRRAILTESAADMSLPQAFRYVWRVRTDVIGIISRSIGDFFFQAIATFAVIFATRWYRISMRQADLVFLVIGIGALLGVLVLGRVADFLLRRRVLTGRVWIGGLAYLLAPLALYPAFSSRSLWFAIPLYGVGAFLLVGAAPPIDAVRVDVIVPRLRGRAESIRQLLRTAAEGFAPVLIGWLSDHLAGGGLNGLYEALVITLPALFFSGAIMLFTLRTYPHDVAAAIASERQNTGTPAAEEHPVGV